jgi:hypothetical protein
MGKAKDQTRKAGKTEKSRAKRENGRFMDIRIADPAVKPRGTTVGEIRRAIESVLARRKRA